MEVVLPVMRQGVRRRSKNVRAITLLAASASVHTARQAACRFRTPQLPRKLRHASSCRSDCQLGTSPQEARTHSGRTAGTAGFSAGGSQTQGAQVPAGAGQDAAWLVGVAPMFGAAAGEEAGGTGRLVQPANSATKVATAGPLRIRHW